MNVVLFAILWSAALAAASSPYSRTEHYRRIYSPKFSSMYINGNNEDPYYQYGAFEREPFIYQAQEQRDRDNEEKDLKVSMINFIDKLLNLFESGSKRDRYSNWKKSEPDSPQYIDRRDGRSRERWEYERMESDYSQEEEERSNQEYRMNERARKNWEYQGIQRNHDDMTDDRYYGRNWESDYDERHASYGEDKEQNMIYWNDHNYGRERMAARRGLNPSDHKNNFGSSTSQFVGRQVGMMNRKRDNYYNEKMKNDNSKTQMEDHDKKTTQGNHDSYRSGYGNRKNREYDDRKRIAENNEFYQWFDSMISWWNRNNGADKSRREDYEKIEHTPNQTHEWKKVMEGWESVMNRWEKVMKEWSRIIGNFGDKTVYTEEDQTIVKHNGWEGITPEESKGWQNKMDFSTKGYDGWLRLMGGWGKEDEGDQHSNEKNDTTSGEHDSTKHSKKDSIKSLMADMLKGIIGDIEEKQNPPRKPDRCEEACKANGACLEETDYQNILLDVPRRCQICVKKECNYTLNFQCFLFGFTRCDEVCPEIAPDLIIDQASCRKCVSECRGEGSAYFRVRGMGESQEGVVISDGSESTDEHTEWEDGEDDMSIGSEMLTGKKESQTNKNDSGTKVGGGAMTSSPQEGNINDSVGSTYDPEGSESEWEDDSQ